MLVVIRSKANDHAEREDSAYDHSGPRLYGLYKNKQMLIKDTYGDGDIRKVKIVECE